MSVTDSVDWTPEDTFGARLALIRNRMGWNVKEAAFACGLTHQSWRNWEAGKGCVTLNDTCKKIARATGCDYRWLVAGGPLMAWDTDAPRLTCVNGTLEPELPFPALEPALSLVRAWAT